MSHYSLIDLPPGWDLRPIVSIANPVTSTVDKKEHEGQTFVRLINYTDVYYNDEIGPGEYMLATASAAQLRRFAVRSNDVAITKDSEASDDIGIAAFVPRALPGHVWGYHLAIYRAYNSRYAKYVKWLFGAAPTKADLLVRTPGVTRVGLSQNSLRYVRVPVPPPQVAEALANYLDRETAEIDAFIADQLQLIALLTERRAATIAHAVTKGLDPSVPMKDSGVEWLGKVPATWTVTPLKSVATFRAGGTPNTSESRYWAGEDEGFDWVAISDFERVRRGDPSEKRVTAEGLLEARLSPQAPPIVLFAMYASVGETALLRRHAVWNQAILGIKPKAPNSTRFLSYVVSAMRPTLNAFFRSNTQNNLNAAQAKSLIAVWPSHLGQREIANFLDRETANIDEAIADAMKAVELSKERRAALITAAVTGQVDVTAHATAREPMEASA